MEQTQGEKNHAKLVLNPFLHKEMFYKTTHFVGD